MSGGVSRHHPIYDVLPTGRAGVDALVELALDLRSSWNHRTDSLWRRLDPDLWESTQNPWVVLQTVSRARLELLLDGVQFRRELDELVEARRTTAEVPAWFQQAHQPSPFNCVAYFSMEFMLSEALPIYSGGLGNVAGDQLKAANDLGVPVVGVGLLYQQGYFRQVLDGAGVQQAIYPYNDPGQLPITPLRQPNGEWLRLKMDLPGHSIWLRAWEAQIGRAKLYLLDSNDAANYPPYRGVTSELYGGGPELRLMQELILGIGGWRLLMALGLDPDVCHLNEGHSAFAILERARCFMAATRLPFKVALSITRAGNLFTTHTAVDAGFDRFEPARIAHKLGDYAERQLGITCKELLALGRQDPDDDAEMFNMAYLALRGSGAVNGVSQLHGSVSRRLFSSLFARWPIDEVPVKHVTNGVHTPTWDSAPADSMWTRACGKGCWLGTTKSMEHQICCASDIDLWRLRNTANAALVEYVRERVHRQLVAAGALPDSVERSKHLLDPDILTIGFARRFATYKRPGLLLSDPARLADLLNHAVCPVQLVMAGKAHPADRDGQALIQQWFEFAQSPAANNRVVFLSDYDMHVAERLVQGVDVWLNTPRRPWEASGTSGMKVLVNGGLNVSVLDGWWAEAYTREVGWAVGDGQEYGDDLARDLAMANELYDLLEHEVAPEFYRRDERGIPSGWVTRMRQSMSQLTPRFSTNRVVREYTEQYYIPAARAYRERASNSGVLGVQIADWHSKLAQHWDELKLGDVRVRSNDQYHVFEIPVYFGRLERDAVCVELYSEQLGNRSPQRERMRCTRELAASEGFLYSGVVSASRPADDYTVRLLPEHRGVAVPLEASFITWEK